MGRKSIERNSKVRATAAMWGLALGMLGVCIPLVAVTQSGIILPMLVILATGGGTAAIWLAPTKRQREELYLAQTIQALEERVMDLETICTSLASVEPPQIMSETKKH